MLSIVKSMSLQGLEGFCVDVQTDVSAGIPSWDIVGLPDTSIRESKERIRAAIKNSNYNLQSRKIVINLAPATLKKEGSIFDLPIAVSILAANGIIKNISDTTIFIGELSLSGELKKVSGILPMCIEALKIGIKEVILPQENSKEAAIVKGLKVIPIKDLNQAVNYLNGKTIIQEQKIDPDEYLKSDKNEIIDFSDVKGQDNIKRALEVAASGGHNCILIGSPGCGKTMMAKRIPTILPDLNFKEALEVTKIHSIAGLLPENMPLINQRPFRAPHHTVTPSSLIGGGNIPKPGEVSLAHLGVLFLDELPEFKRNTLEVLRGPLEDRKITISRVSASLTYPCQFMLVASLNPCPCGYYGSDKECNCTPEMIKKYIGKISGPLLDRIDIHVEVSSIKYDKLSSNKKEETSCQIKNRVNNARNIQKKRYAKYGIFCNADMTPQLIEKFCVLDKECERILKNSYDRLGLSARGYSRILKVARTIADLDNSDKIKPVHLLEAIQYRSKI